GAEIQALLLAGSDQLDDMTPDELAALIKATVVKDNSKNLHAPFPFCLISMAPAPSNGFARFSKLPARMALLMTQNCRQCLGTAKRKLPKPGCPYSIKHTKRTPLPPRPKTSWMPGKTSG